MAKYSWRLGVLVVGVLMALGVSAAVYAVNTKPDLTVQISPASQTVEQSKSVTFTITLTSVNGLTGSVTPSASGFASGASAMFSPATLNLTSGGSATTTMTVTTSSTAKTGSTNFSVIATSGKVSSSVNGTLSVTPPMPGTLALSSTPSSVSVAPGSVAAYSLTLTRNQVPGTVTLAVATSLPAGVTASFTPSSTTGTSATLQVATSDGTNDGSYPIQVNAAGTDSSGNPIKATATVTLVVKTTPKDFSLGGNVSGVLAPGVSRPVNITVSNPNRKPVSITNLSVTIAGVQRAQGAPAGFSCTAADYSVTQYSGPYPATVPALATKTLGELGISSSQWPQLTMLNRAVNQDGCKGATVTLTFSGSGQGN